MYIIIEMLILFFSLVVILLFIYCVYKLIFKSISSTKNKLKEKEKVVIDVNFLNILNVFIKTEWTGSYKKINKKKH